MQNHKTTTKKRKRITKILFLIALLLLVASLIEPFWLKFNEVSLVDSDLPPSFEGKTIVFLSDIHHGPFFSRKRIRRLVDRINRLNPDIVLLGGDYVHRDKRYITPIFEELSRLKPALFLGGVLGNHDHWESTEQSKHELQKAGIQELDNQAFWVKTESEAIKIGGVGDYMSDNQDLEATVNDVSREDFVVLVSHNPDYFQEIPHEKIDLMLAGHTHGGQVTFFGLFAPFLPIKYKHYWKGRYSLGDASLFITTGVGTLTPPVRFFARPEILLIHLSQGEM